MKVAFTAADVLLDDGLDADEYKVDQGKSLISPHWLQHSRNIRVKQKHGLEAAQQYMGHEDWR